MTIPQPRLLRISLLVASIGLLGLILFGIYAGTVAVEPAAASSGERADSLAETSYLPLLANRYVPPAGRLCRFGVGGETNIDTFDVNSLRLGWYVDWRASEHPTRPGEISYMPMIRLRQTGPTSYSYTPGGTALTDTIQANPGALWLIGNEPDRADWQDDLEPHVYANAYHELYHRIKDQDPTARIAAGGIVQPTPLRLQYLDMVLDEYQTRYGTAMPVDVWNIHNFILREEEGAWGAEIPPGIDATQGMLYEIDDNADIEIFKQHIRWFRQWMADNGYQNRPLIITEFGVQMWPDLGFPPERVNAFMDATFEYLSTATGNTGYPADANRLVQRWAWYSLSDDEFNGWLFNPDTRARTVFGDNFAQYTHAIQATVNVAPVRLQVASNPTTGTLNLTADVVNNGNVTSPAPISGRYYDGNPNSGGTLIAFARSNSALRGCATKKTLVAEWQNASPGQHTIYVVVDPENAIVEADEQDNVYSATIQVSSPVEGTAP